MRETQNRTEAQSSCANPDYQRHYDYEFTRRPCHVARDREASSQWPGNSEAAGGQEVRCKMR